MDESSLKKNIFIFKMQEILLNTTFLSNPKTGKFMWRNVVSTKIFLFLKWNKNFLTPHFYSTRQPGNLCGGK